MDQDQTDPMAEWGTLAKKNQQLKLELTWCRLLQNDFVIKNDKTELDPASPSRHEPG